MAAGDRGWLDQGDGAAPAALERPSWATPASDQSVRAWHPVDPNGVAEPPRDAPAPESAAPRAEAASPPEPRPEPVHTFNDGQLADLEASIVSELREPYLAAAATLAAAVHELEQRLYDDIVDLAVRLAEAVVHRAVELDRGILLENTRRALRLAGPVARMTLKCAEEDAAFLREHIDASVRDEVGQAIELIVRPSDDIDIGGCLLTYDSGIVDARIPLQLARLAAAVKAALHDTAAQRPMAPADEEDDAP